MKGVETDERDERDVYQEFWNEAYEEPLDWFKHYTNAHESDALRRGILAKGMEWYGKWWAFVEAISRRRRHVYDVSDEVGWRLLTLDLSACGWQLTVDDAKEFIGELYESDLIDRECFDESSLVMSERVLSNADEYANNVAKGRLGAWKTNRSRAKKRGA